MTALATYFTGTVSVGAGGTVVTGLGSVWSGVNVRPGDILQIGNFQTLITDVTDPTHLVVLPWGGGAQSGVAYKICQVSPQRFAGAQAMADVSAMVAALNTNGLYVFVDPSLSVPDPSLGNNNQYAFQPTTGIVWQKTGGVWNFIGVYKGFGLPLPWSGATPYNAFDVASLAGTSYVCILAHTNHTPPNATYWTVLASIGATGTTGATGATGTAGANGTNAPTYGGTSTTSLAIGIGSKAFTTQAGLAYLAGARVRASSTANTSNWMEGLVTYSGTALTITVDKINGSGTIASWNFNLVGQPGTGDLSSANNLSDVASAATARANLSIPILGYIYGLLLSDAGFPYTSLNVTAGSAVNSTGVDVLTAPAFSKHVDQAWTVGISGGAVDVGTTITAGNFYNVFIIKRPDTGVVDFAISLSSVAPTIGGNIPSAYTLSQWIGAFLAASGPVISPFYQLGSNCYYKTAVSNLSAAVLNASRLLVTTSAPPNKIALIRVYGVNSGSGSFFLVQPTAETDRSASPPASFVGTGAGLGGGGHFEIPVDGSSQIAMRAGVASCSIYVETYGWKNPS